MATALKKQPSKSTVDMTNVVRLDAMRKSVKAPNASIPMVAGGNVRTVGTAQAITGEQVIRTAAAMRQDLKRASAHDGGAHQSGTNPRYRLKRKLMNTTINAGLMFIHPVLGVGSQLADMSREVFTMHRAVNPHQENEDGYHARPAETHSYSEMDALNAFMARGPGFGPAPVAIGETGTGDIVTDHGFDVPYSVADIMALEATAHRIKDSGEGVVNAFSRSPVLVAADNEDDLPGGGNRALEVDGVRALALQTDKPQEIAEDRPHLTPKLALAA